MEETKIDVAVEPKPETIQEVVPETVEVTPETSIAPIE